VFAAHPDTTALGPFTALGCPSLDQFSFEFREVARNGQHQPTGGGRGISPAFSQRHEQCLVVGHCFQDHQQSGPTTSISGSSRFWRHKSSAVRTISASPVFVHTSTPWATATCSGINGNTAAFPVAQGAAPQLRQRSFLQVHLTFAYVDACPQNERGANLRDDERQNDPNDYRYAKSG
jgi:hypothetical protein